MPDVVRLLRQLLPEPVGSEASIRHWFESEPPRARFVALGVEDAGELAGIGWAGLEWQTSEPGVASAWAGVREDARRRGLGTELADRLEAHLAGVGARTVETFAGEGSRGLRFAHARGYRDCRVERLSSVDPREVDYAEPDALEAALAAEGLRVEPLEALRNRPADLHALDAATAVDVPADHPEDDLRYEEWLVGTYAEPDLSWDGSRVAFQGDRPVAFTLLQVEPDTGRAENDMTGTLREYRGRGLARLVKLSALRWAAENGVVDLWTGNDETNTAMLAVNERLGYRPRARLVSLEKALR